MSNQHKQMNKLHDGIEEAFSGLPVSRRWMLRNTANAAAGVLAASALGSTASRLDAEAVRTAAPTEEDRHADQPAGYIHALHGWDTI